MIIFKYFLTFVKNIFCIITFLKSVIPVFRTFLYFKIELVSPYYLSGFISESHYNSVLDGSFSNQSVNFRVVGRFRYFHHNILC